MKHFINIETMEEARKLYRALAKEHHPDKGGNEEIMKEINNEYDFISAKILKGENLNTEEFNEAWSNEQLFKERINNIINIPGIVIEIVGLWIWITGETRPVKDQIKAAGFWFASKKIAWYWRPEHAAGGRGKHTLDEIRNKYGSQIINASTNHKYRPQIN